MASRTEAVVALALALAGCGNCGESEMFLPWTSKSYDGHETCGK